MTAAPPASRRAPLTWQQEWGLKHWQPRWRHWAIPLAVRLRGSLQVQMLAQCFSDLTRRHESLRTRIVVDDGAPEQIIDRPTEYELKIVKIPAGSSEDRDSMAQRVIREFMAKSIDLAEGPLFDTCLYELASDDHVLAVAIQHVISDADSVQLLFRELWSLYSAYVRGKPAPVADVHLQYADYAHWQWEQRTRWNDEHGPYWRSKLEDTKSIQLPLDRDVCNDKPFGAAALSFKFDSALGPELNNLARREGIMPSVVKLAAYAMLLSRWSGQRDFVIPFVVAGRFTAKFAGVMGLLGQFLPVRIKVTGEETFVDFARATAREFAAAVQHLDFGRVMTERPELLEGVSLNCIPYHFGVTVPKDWPRDDSHPRIEPFPIGPRSIEDSTLPWDVSCSFIDTDKGTVASMLYRADRFKRETMERLLADQQLIWNHIVRNPRVRSSWLCASL